jgi:hypothetical protein
MKIYIENVLPKNINMNALEKFYNKTIKTVEIFSKEQGFFSIESGKLSKLTPHDSAIKKIQYKKWFFLIDESYWEKEMVVQLPYDHIYIESNYLYFCVGGKERKESQLYLVIKEDMTDFYFWCKEGIDSEEIDVLLELLL